MACVIQIRNDSSANWTSVNPVLAIGELAISNDLSNFKIGDGVSAWSALSYVIPTAMSTESVQDIVGALVVDSGSIDFTYDDVANTLTAAVIPSGVNHDNLLNMSANKHVDHTLVSITGTGALTGGGDISSSRTINLTTAGTAGTYGNSSSVPVLTTDTYGRVTSVTPTNISITSGAVNDFTEAVQDVLGALLIDTNTINFTYDDVANTLGVDVKTQMSITSDALGLMLSGDSASPGNTKLYGTNDSGVKGWYDQPGAGVFYRKDEDISIVNPYIITFNDTAETGVVTHREEIVLFNQVSGDTNWSNVVLLLKFNGANGSTTFTDSSDYARTIVGVGTAQISTAQSRFGGSSLLCDGNGDYVYDNSVSQLFIDTSDYTIEGWFYTAETGVVRDLITWGLTPYWNIWKNATNQLIFSINGADRITGGTFTPNTWNHVAVSRQSGTNRLFLNGALIGSYVDNTSVTAGVVRIGHYPGADASAFNGYIDEVRITTDVARYTGAFTAPTSEFIVGGNKRFAIGTQDNDLYFRTDNGFAWYKRGSFINASDEPGTGGTVLMLMDNTGNLIIGSNTALGTQKLQVNGSVYMSGFDLPSAARGDIVFRNATQFTRLPAGTSGQVLLSAGPGLDPAWGSTSPQGLFQGGGYASGQYYDNALLPNASTTLAGVANRLDVAPFVSPRSLTIDEIGVAVSTTIAGSNIRVVIYSNGSNGWPNTLLYQSANIATTSAGYQSVAASFTFQAGVVYWVGVHHSSTSTLRAIAIGSTPSLGLNGSNGATYFTLLRQTVAFGSAPATWTFATGQLTNSAVSSIRFRSA
jgi:hypothetical protein